MFFRTAPIIIILISLVFGNFSLAGDVPYVPYVQLGTSSIIYDFKTGVSAYPIYYYLSTKNIGPQKARFDIISDSPWIFVYREGEPGATSFQLYHESTINFVMEIRAEQPKDGVNRALVTVNAVSNQDYTVIDTKKVEVILNKNISSPSPSPSASPIVSSSPSVSQSPTPTLSISISPSSTLPPTTSIKPPPTTIFKPAISNLPTKSQAPKTLSAPKINMTPNLSLAPSAAVSQMPLPETNQSRGILIKFWRFLMKIFF